MERSLPAQLQRRFHDLRLVGDADERRCWPLRAASVKLPLRQALLEDPSGNPIDLFEPASGYPERAR
jgi:hypothetical protein